MTQSPEMMLAEHQAERERRAERAPTEEFLQIKAVFALSDMRIKDAEMKYGWQGGASETSASDPDLCHVASREIGGDREIVIYQIETSPGEMMVRFEVYAAGECIDMKVPGTGDWNTMVAMSLPTIDSWG